MTGLLPKTKSAINSGTSWKRQRKHKKRSISKKPYCEKPMTVCIAAIAEVNTEHPKIVIRHSQKSRSPVNLSEPAWVRENPYL